MSITTIFSATPAGSQHGDTSGIPPEVVAAAAPVIAAAESGAVTIMAATGAPYGGDAYKASAAEQQRIEAAALAANKQLILSALKAAGVTSAVVEYAGDGDSGGVSDTTLFYETGKDGSAKGAFVYLIRSGYGWVKDQGVTISVQKLSLVAGLGEFSECDLVSHFGHSGYENNDGGYGTVTLDVEEGSITLDHSDYIMSTDDSSHEL